MCVANFVGNIIFGRIRYIGMRIRLYVTPPLDIFTSLGFLLKSVIVKIAYNNCTWDPKHCQNEEDLE